MGRLPTLIDAVLVAAFAITAGCDDNKPKVTVTNERSQAILGAPSATGAAPAPKPSVVSLPVAPKAPRKLCGGHLGKSGPGLPTEAPTRRSATGERELPEQIATGGHYTWINFWAAWCAPCKEEIPRLLSWENKLEASGIPLKVVFVSLDDDERQLTSFLDKQPANGLRSTYWLPDGVKRTDWLKAVNVKPDVELPVQLLLDKAGHVRCTIAGAVDDSDYEPLRGLLNGPE
jgi:thiol-disulfide isomerase/thioredoxin